MTENKLTSLVALGESQTLEFKKSTSEKEAALRTLCGMANSLGGSVLIGVVDSRRIIGQDVSDATLKELAQAFMSFDPALAPRVDTVRLSTGKSVLVLTVESSPFTPHVYQGRAYRRVTSTTSVMPQVEYQRKLLERDHAKYRWETLPAHGKHELDMLEVQRCLTESVVAGRSDFVFSDPLDALRKLRLIDENGITQAAVVAFATDPMPHYPQCALRLARFRGVTKAEFLDQKQLHGHAFHLLREADLFLRRHLPVAGRFESGVMERIDEPLFPPLALREALVNALIHRDYSISGGALNVAIFDDRVEIISTGTLPFGQTVDDLCRDHVSKPRNELLAGLFYRRGLIEKWGRGTQKIIQLCIDAGHPAPEFEERSGDVIVRFLPSGYAPPHRIEHDLTERQRRILFALKHGRAMKSKDITTLIDPMLPTRTLQTDLKLLQQWGLISKLGHGPSSKWMLV